MNYNPVFKKNIKCPHCGHEFEINKKTTYCAKADRDCILFKNIFEHKCPHCGEVVRKFFPIRYIDDENKFVVYFGQLVEMFFLEDEYKNDPNFKEYTVCASNTVNDLKTNIIALENKLDWRIAKTYLTNVIRDNKKDGPDWNNRYSSEIDEGLIYKDNKLYVSMTKEKSQTVIIPFDEAHYKDIYNQFIEWVDDLKPFIFSSDCIQAILERKKYDITHPICQGCFLYIKGEGLCLAYLNDIDVGRIQRGDTVNCIRTKDCARRIGLVMGIREMDYYKIPISIYEIYTIKSKHRTPKEKTYIPNDIHIDNDYYLNVLLELKKGNFKKRKRELIIALSNMTFIMVHPETGATPIYASLSDRDEDVIYSAYCICSKKVCSLALFTDEDKITVEGKRFMVNFETVVDICENNPYIIGVTINPHKGDETIFIDYVFFENYIGESVVFDKEAATDLFNTLTEEEKAYLPDYEYEYLKLKLVGKKSDKEIMKILNINESLFDSEKQAAETDLAGIAEYRKKQK